jgi:hypothetical protein
MPLTFLRARPRGIHRGFFSLIMPLHTRKELVMPYQQEKCLKVFFNPYFTSIGLIICHAAPKDNWTHSKDAPRMRHGTNPLTGEPQSFYFSDDHLTMPGWFKGMEQILKERGLWPEAGLAAQCSGKCPDNRDNCCCHNILFNQPDFVSQKSQLQELIESCNHLCDFYPKYHCELNFIEQYWGAAKLWFHVAGRGATMDEMKKKVLACLDDIPLDQIRRCVQTVLVLIIAFLLVSVDMPIAQHGLFMHMERA